MLLKNVLKVKDPKLSRVLTVQNDVYAAVHGAIGEDRKLAKKKCSRHLIDARECVNKNFVHSSSIALIWGKHARYVITILFFIDFFFTRTTDLTEKGRLLVHVV